MDDVIPRRSDGIDQAIGVEPVVPHGANLFAIDPCADIKTENGP